MKIVHAHKYYYARRGAERYMLALMKAQFAAGHEVIPFAMDHPENIDSFWSDYFPPEVKSIGAGAIAQTRRAYRSKEVYQYVARLFDEIRPDVLHVHNLYTHLSTSVLKAAHERGIRIVMTVHDYHLVSANYALWNPSTQLPIGTKPSFIETMSSRFIKGSMLKTAMLELIRRRTQQDYLHYVDTFIVGSRFMEEVLVKNGFPQSSIEHIPLFADSSIPVRARKVKREVLYIGALERNKGIETLLAAMREIPQLTLRIAGSGQLEAEFKSRYTKSKRVIFEGQVQSKRLAELYSQAMMLVVPSEWHEPFGLVAVEAMRAGVPLVVSDMGALPEIVQEGKVGSIFEAGEVDDLREHIKRLAANSKQREEFSKRGKQRAKEVFSLEKHAKRVQQLYRG
ncbi:MAG: glycosyltransferase [bacterium]|nr:glycosyltransferase [bacterium]MDA1024775.1 glycosyltransferase [bacterium]